jgi:outer membrane protein
MKKISIVVIALIALLGANNASAQKIGYINLDQVMGQMPEIARIDTAMQSFQADSLNPRYQYLYSEFARKDSMANGKDSLKNYPNAGVRAEVRRDVEGLAYQLQNWQQYAQQEMQAKQNELLAPVYRKVLKAVNDVAKENNYAYVIREENLLVAPPADNLVGLVAKKLNLKGATGAGTGAAPAGPKPPAGKH